MNHIGNVVVSIIKDWNNLDLSKEEIIKKYNVSKDDLIEYLIEYARKDAENADIVLETLNEKREKAKERKNKETIDEIEDKMIDLSKKHRETQQRILDDLKIIEDLYDLEYESSLADDLKEIEESIISSKLSKEKEENKKLAEKIKKDRELSERSINKKTKSETDYSKLESLKGLSKYRMFIKLINGEPFMINFKGDGKRKAQTILYNLYKTFVKEGNDVKKFSVTLDSLTKFIKSENKNKHLSSVKEFIELLKKNII